MKNNLDIMQISPPPPTLGVERVKIVESWWLCSMGISPAKNNTKERVLDYLLDDIILGLPLYHTPISLSRWSEMPLKTNWMRALLFGLIKLYQEIHGISTTKVQHWQICLHNKAYIIINRGLETKDSLA